MKTREQAEARALELFPIHEEFDVDRLKPLRDAYLQGWEEAQDNQLREAAEKVVVVNYMSSIRVPIEVERAIEQLEKALR